MTPLNSTINFTELAPLFSCYPTTCVLLGYLEKEFAGLIEDRITQALPKTRSPLGERDICLLSAHAAKAIATFPYSEGPKKLPLRFAPRDLICGPLQGWVVLDKREKGDKQIAEKGQAFYAIDLLSGELAVHKLISSHEKELLDALHKLSHLAQTRCIVPTQKNGIFYQVQKHCNQGDLFAYLFTEQGPKKTLRYDNSAEREKIKICLAIAEGIAELHAQKVMHRDLKPENILCELNGEDLSILLGDTGFATHESDVERRKQWKGTCGYLCPEAATPEYSADYTDDSWSFGLLMHIMLLAEHPHEAWLQLEPKKEEFIKAMSQLKEHLMHKRFPNPPPRNLPYAYMVYNLLHLDPKKRMSCTEAFTMLCDCYAKDIPLKF